VYVSPIEGEVEEFFHMLTQRDHYPPNEIQVYAGDFNAHVAEELEQHITIQERSNIPVRVGGCHRRHLPSPPDAAPITRARVSSQQRGRLLLRMQNTTSFLILNGRFESPDDPIPYTLQRQDEATTNDYNLIAKQFFSKVKTCYVISRPSRTLRSQPGPPTDHNPIVLHLSLLSKSGTPAPSATAVLPELPPRTQFHSSKLKDPVTRKKFSEALKDQSTKAQPAFRAPKISLQQGTINPTQYAKNVNTIIVSALQVTAHENLGTTAFRCKNAQKEHVAQRGHTDNGSYSCTDKRIKEKQTSTQTLRNKVRQARKESAPSNVIADLGKSHAKEKHELWKLQHQARQKTVTDAIESSVPNAGQQKSPTHSMWDLLLRYKTDHVQSNLPTQTHDNSSPDARIWKLGPLIIIDLPFGFPINNIISTRPTYSRPSGVAPVQVCPRTPSLETCTVPL